MSFNPEATYVNPFTQMYIPSYSLKSSSIDDILNRSDARLEELLDDENFIFELKNSNPRLLDYFTKNTEKLKQLVEYIIRVAPDANDNKRAYQYPLLADEIFEADIPSIMNLFFSNNPISGGRSPYSNSSSPAKDGSSDYNRLGYGSNIEAKSEGQDLLAHLFSFFNTKDELNPVLATHFNKLVQKLIKRNQKKIVEYIYSDERVLPMICDHIGHFPIAEIVPSFICYQSYLFDEVRPEILKIKTKSVEKILNTLSAIHKPEEMSHVADILADIIKNRDTMADGKEIMNLILSKDNLDRLFSIVLNERSSSSVIGHVCNALSTIFDHYVSKVTGPYSTAGFYPSYYDDPIVASILGNFDAVTRLLSQERNDPVMTTFGNQTRPFGLGKIKVIELLEKMIKMNNQKVNTKIRDTGVLQTLTNLFSKHLWNNILHQTYEKVVYTILDKRDPVLLEALFEKVNIIQFIIREFKEEQFSLPKNGKKIRKGNLGHIIRISNEIERIAGFEKKIEEYLKRNPEWDSFVSPLLKTRNEIHNRDMGGHRPINIFALFSQGPPGGSPATPTTPTAAGGYQLDVPSSSKPQAEQQQPQSFMLGLNSPKDSTIPPFSPEKQGPAGYDASPIPSKDSSLSFYSQQNFNSYSYDPLNLNLSSQNKEDKNKESKQKEIQPFGYTEKSFSDEKRPGGFVEIKIQPAIDATESTSDAKNRKSDHQNSLKVDTNHHLGGNNLTKHLFKTDDDIGQHSSEFLSLPSNKNFHRSKSFSPVGQDLDIPDFLSVSPTKSDSPNMSADSSPVFAQPSKALLNETHGRAMFYERKFEKLNENKLVEMFNKYKAPNTNNSLEFSYSQSTLSESDIITDISPVSTGRLSAPSTFSSDFTYARKDIISDRGYF